VWWFRLAIPALGRRAQKNLKFEASLGYITTISKKKKKFMVIFF
jgi:hypothetical protein